jgi:hypothetical protein
VPTSFQKTWSRKHSALAHARDDVKPTVDQMIGLLQQPVHRLERFCPFVANYSGESGLLARSGSWKQIGSQHFRPSPISLSRNSTRLRPR